MDTTEKASRFPTLIHISDTDWIIIQEDGTIEGPLDKDGYWVSTADIYQGDKEVGPMKLRLNIPEEKSNETICR